MSSRNALRADFEQVVSSIKSRKIDPAIFITHRTKFEEVRSEFSNWLDPQNRVIKAMVEIG